MITNPYRNVTAVTFGNFSHSFDGVDQSVDIGAISELNSSTNISISYWVKKTASDDQSYVGSFEGATNGFWLQWFTDGNVYCSFRNGTTASADYALSWTSDTWVHLTGTWDGTIGTESSRTKIYVDGVNVATGSGTSALNTSGANDFNIAQYSGSTFSTCKLADVRLYNRTLTQNDIDDGIGGGIYNFKNITNGLIGWWLTDKDDYNDYSNSANIYNGTGAGTPTPPQDTDGPAD